MARKRACKAILGWEPRAPFPAIPCPDPVKGKTGYCEFHNSVEGRIEANVRAALMSNREKGLYIEDCERTDLPLYDLMWIPRLTLDDVIDIAVRTVEELG